MPADHVSPKTSVASRGSQITESPAKALGSNALGPVNLDYYAPIWARYEASNRVGATWNWSAALYTVNWMIFRKLWLPARIYAGTVLCAMAVLTIIHRASPLSEAFQLGSAVLLLLAGIVVPGAFGNAWFIADIQRKILKAVETSSTLAEANLKLKNQASTRHSFIRMLQINGSLALAATLGSWIYFSQSEPPIPKVVKNQTETAAQTQAGVVAPQIALSAPLATSIFPEVVEIAKPNNPASNAPVADFSALASAPVSLPASSLKVCEDCRSDTRTARENGEPNKTSTLLTPEKIAPLVPLARNAPKAGPDQKIATIQTLKPQALEKQALKQQELFINVGLFAKPANGEAAHALLKDAGLPAVKQEIATASGKRLRVRVGPFTSQAVAEEAAVKIRLLNLEAKVVLSGN